MKFKIGDKVKWKYYSGKILKIENAKKKTYKVLFDEILFCPIVAEKDLKSA